MSPEECVHESHRLLPPHTRYGFVAWALVGARMGSFGMAVVKNDLADAMGRADLESRAALHTTVLWLHNYAPRGCWGNPKRVEEWEGWPGLSLEDARVLLQSLA